MSKDMWTSGGRALALSGALFTLCGFLGACGAPEAAVDDGAVEDGSAGLAIRVLPDEADEADKGTADASPQAAGLGLSAKELAFGARCAGTSTNKTLELRSTGSSALTLRTLSVRGAAFRLVTPPPLPAQLAPGKRLLLTVRYTPQPDRPDDLAPTGTLIINSSASGQPSVSVALRGTVPPLQFAIRPSTLDLGSMRVGQLVTRNLQLRNGGACPVSIGGFDMAGALQDAVLIGDPGEAPLRAGATRNVEVIGACDQRGTIDATASFFTAFGQALGTAAFRGVCQP